METCVRCGAELGVGRFCLNCGNPVGDVVADDVAFIPWQDETADEAEERLRAESTSRPPWLPWTLGAVALVAVTMALASWLGGGEDDSGPDTATAAQGQTTEDAAREEAEPEETEPESSPSPTPSGKPRNLARGATAQVPATAPPTTDLDGQLVAYEAAQMFDGAPSTAWRMPGDGTGASITITLRQESVLTRVGLVNGYAKQVSGVDWYPNNRRILAVRWTFDDGTTVEQSLTETPAVQVVEVEPVATTRVVLTFVTVAPPGAGTLGRDYTPISEVSLIGTPAG